MKAKFSVFLQGAAIAAAGVWVYWPVLNGGWLRDDVWEVSRNPVLREPAGRIWRIWFAPASPNFFPLKTTVQWLEWRIWGDHQAGYHLVNLGLHVLSALLIWRLLDKVFAVTANRSTASAPATPPGPRAFGAWIGGLLFAVHPMAVESVAWISELKNVLSLPPLLFAMGAWVDWEAESEGRAGPLGPPAPTRIFQARWGWRVPPYWAALFWFFIAMLCKTSVAMFPLVLLLYAWWRRDRIAWRDVLATLPFAAISIGLGLITLFFEKDRVIGGFDLGLGGPGSRLATAGLAVDFYLCKFVVPLSLLPVYPRWSVNPPGWTQFLPWLVPAAAGAWLWPVRGRWDWRRPAVFGFGFFLINLLPVIGLVPMGYLRTAWTADHFCYLPQVGLIGLAGSALGRIVAGRRFGKGRLAKTGLRAGMLLIPILALAAGLAICSRSYARMFRDEETLWKYTLRHFPASWIAHNDLGLVLAGSGRLPAAIGHYREALRLNPGSAEVNYDFGNALVSAGRLPEAIDLYEKALRLNPGYVEALVNLGNARFSLGQDREAIRGYRQALDLDPDLPEARYDLANALLEIGSGAEAIGQYEGAIRLRPDYFAAHYRLANALANAGRLLDAIRHYQEAVRLNPASAEACANLGLALAGLDRCAEAIAALEAALRLRPDYAEAHAYLGFALAKCRRLTEAVAQYEQALGLAPNNPDIHYQLAAALRSLGRKAEADAQFAIASRLQGAN